jgi:tetratricopeptide (TPR) repeat protein
VKILEKVRPLMRVESARAEAALKEIKPTAPRCSISRWDDFRFQQETYPRALASFERAVTKFPSFRRAWRDIGLIKTVEQRYDDAIKALHAHDRLGGGDAYSYGLLGSRTPSKRDYQAAEAAYRDALLLQPDNTRWRVQLALCVYKEDKFEDAAALLDV